MKKNDLANDILQFLQEENGTPRPGSAAEAPVRATRSKIDQAPPAAVWQGIQANIAAGAGAPTLLQRLKEFMSTPAAPVFAVALAATIGGAFFLMNRATAPLQVPLVEITAVQPQKAGTVIVARGLRIESVSGGSIERISGNADKIVLQTGNWSVTLQHAELERRTQFIFPGGALEPLGTAFTIQISPTGTAVSLTEGKIRLMEFDAAAKSWRARELAAPFAAVVGAQPIERDLPEAAKPVEEPKSVSRYARLAGKSVAVELKNGDRLSGKVVATSQGKVVLESSAGRMTVRESDILNIAVN
ncbi:hypothetical protein [Turneriella parva]|uniref:FecR family protein n=1 Tax=Turneriella parva (strain ATCC BAA-1111 / DSM 21527 / NCTC 11395 / H) TaxID=869212 RepID=I4B6U3_TURPD|nr:hypothetical protein [Turneriella parva]AFM13000.1 hypothetical protein Turpa_2357 [Turneriella parva DSM 21527]